MTPGTRSSRAISEACSEAGTAAPRSRRTGLQHRLGQLLDEQRHPVGPGRDLAQHLRRQGLLAGQARDDRLGRAAAEAVEREPGHVRVPAQGGLVVGPAGQQHQHAAPAIRSRAEPHQLEGGGVDPVRVLEHHQHRPAAREPEELLDQRRQRAGAPLLRGEVGRRVAAAGVDPEQRRDQRRRLADVVRALPQQRLELVELRRLGVGGREAGGEAELLGDRPERGAGVVGRALVAERGVRPRAPTASSTARTSRDLPIPASPTSSTAWPSPAVACRQRSSSERQLLVAADQGQRPARPAGLEAALGGALAEDAEGRAPARRSP